MEKALTEKRQWRILHAIKYLVHSRMDPKLYLIKNCQPGNRSAKSFEEFLLSLQQQQLSSMSMLYVIQYKTNTFLLKFSLSWPPSQIGILLPDDSLASFLEHI